MSTSQKILTKSKYLNGLQCSRLLWISVNTKDRLPEVDEAKQKLFDEGHIVGEFAKKLFSNGIDIEDEDFSKNLEETKKLLKENKILFEPAFLVDRLYSRADILEPTKEGWNIVEVKSSTEVKDVNIQDVAFQRYVYEKAGLKINKCFLLHINNQYVRQGEINASELFTKEDISINVAEEIKLVPERSKQMLEVIDSKEPVIKIGDFCNKPYECSMKGECWAFLPKENSVFDLYRGGKKSWELFEDGILAIKDIPTNIKLNDKQQIQLECEKTQKAHINENLIKEFLKTLKYPLYFLDFETYQTAIPLYNGLKPYQQIPFQFSVHKIDNKGKKTHYSFIASGKKDPRKKFINAIKRKLGTKGSVIVYNQVFEQGRLKEIGELFPLEKQAVDKIIERMVDLLIPFRNFDYYDRKQEGSASIKYVLPAMTNMTYKGMEIANGGQASIRYAYITHGDIDGNKAKKEEIKKVREDLKKYCGLDTEAMILVLKKLREMT
ncbi:MAG: DUF2779 domain-containing protein [Nanoarchaeota archaeon]|nr:DUF2779 domain-containing protein [Nanoarchaeota archaeon]